MADAGRPAAEPVRFRGAAPLISQPAPRRALATVCALACLVLLAANALATPSDEDGRLEQVQADAQLATRLAEDAISFAAGGMLTDASQSLQSAKVALERASRGIAGREGPVATAVTGAHAAVGRASAAVERAGRRPRSRREVPAASKERAAERARTRAHTAEIAKLVRAAELGLGKATHLAQVVRETAADDRPTTVRGNVDRVAAAAAKVRAAAQGLAAMGADPGLIETSSQQAETAEAIVVSIGEHATRVLAERQAAHAQERTGWIASAVAEGLELTRSARARAAAAGSGPGQ